MKILYNSDSHGDLEALETFRDFSLDRDIDIIVSAGDLISGVFNKPEYALMYFKSCNVLRQVREQNKIRASLGDLAAHIIENEAPEGLKQIASLYLNATKIARDGMLRQYESIKRIFDSFNKPVLTIPGNYDGVCIDNVLADENLHLKPKREIRGATFAGCGGADFIPTHIPEDLIVDFIEGQTEDGFVSHLYDHLSKEDPDVAVVHIPPYGICDVIGEGMSMREDGSNEGKHTGSKGIQKYIMEENPNLVLVGHVHEGIGLNFIGNTVVVNPGSIARSNSTNPLVRCFYERTFAEISLNRYNYVSEVIFYQIREFGKKDGVREITRFADNGEGLERINN